MRLMEKDLQERLKSHLLMLCVEKFGELESMMTEDNDLKVRWDTQADYMVVDEIWSMHQKVDS